MVWYVKRGLMQIQSLWASRYASTQMYTLYNTPLDNLSNSIHIVTLLNSIQTQQSLPPLSAITQKFGYKLYHTNKLNIPITSTSSNSSIEIWSDITFD